MINTDCKCFNCPLIRPIVREAYINQCRIRRITIASLCATYLLDMSHSQKTLFGIALIAATAAALSAAVSDDARAPVAKPCDWRLCGPPNCRCFDAGQPGGLEDSRIPQMVLMSFNDAITANNYMYYDEAFSGKKNPDGCPVAATYFVTHEYTDYERVHMLYSKGHEIALHSITKTTGSDYWKNAPVSLLRQEFIGERKLIAKFSSIPKVSIKGMRMPFLQLSGNASFQLIRRSGLKYDCSWPTQRFIDPPLWPYTLDYASGQDCIIPPCPNEAIPGVWVVPMVDWTDDGGQFCATVDACQNIEHTVDGLFGFMKRNFERHYSTSRAPFGFATNAAWFLTHESHFEAYKKFVDYLLSMPDVYIVNIQRMLQWMENPQPIGNLAASWPECQPIDVTSCSGTTCRLKKDEEERVMKQCSTCPNVYPWLGNPLGE